MSWQSTLAWGARIQSLRWIPCIVAADWHGSTWCSPRTIRQADDRLRRVYSDCYIRERRITGYIEYLAVVKSGFARNQAHYNLMLSKWLGPPVSAAVLARIDAALDGEARLL